MHRTFQPSPADPLDFEATIEKSLIELNGRFAVREVRYDPWQMLAVAQRLRAAGLPMTEFPQTVPNLTEASQNLFELIKGRNLIVYPDDDLRLAVKRAVAIETARGWRISKDKASHKIDVVVALAQAALGAVRAGATVMAPGQLASELNQIHSAAWSRNGPSRRDQLGGYEVKPLNAVADDALHLLKDPALSPEGRAAACVEQVRSFAYPNAARRDAATELLRAFADGIPHLRTNADGLGLMQAAGNPVMGARRLAEALPTVQPGDEIRRVAPAMTRFNYTGAEIDAIRGALRKDERIQQVEEFAVKTDQRIIELNEEFYDSLRPGSWTLRDTWLSQFRRPGPGPARAEEAEGHPLRARFVS